MLRNFVYGIHNEGNEMVHNSSFGSVPGSYASRGKLLCPCQRFSFVFVFVATYKIEIHIYNQIHGTILWLNVSCV